jgi:Zn-dependent alcohol dehydrogenase
MALTGQRGADVVFEVVGLGPTIDQALAMTRRGGQTVLVGIPAMDVTVTVPAFLGLVLQEKAVQGCWYGSSDVRRDIPRLLELHEQGRLELAGLVSAEVGLDQVPAALEALRAGEVARTVVVF